MIGIMGDSHDCVESMKKAVEFFNKEETDMVVMTGDLVSPFMVEHLRGLESGIRGVFGNNEGDKKTINDNLADIDVELADFLEFEYDGMNIAVYHGHNPSILDSIVKSCKYDIVLTGHTHTPEVTIEGNTLIVNPGELCGYLSGSRTVALVDPQAFEARICEIK